MSENRFAHLMLAPAGLWLLLLFAVPLCIVLAVSLGTTDPVYQAVYGWHPELRRRVRPAVRPGAAALGRLRARHRGPLPADRLSDRLLHRPLRRSLEDAVDRGRRAAVPGQLPGAHVCLGGDPLRRGPGERNPRRHRHRRERGPHGEHVVGRDRWPRLRLPGIHDPAAVRGARPYGPGADRGGKDLYGTRWQTFWHVTWPAAFQGWRPAAYSSSSLPWGTSSQPSCSVVPIHTWSGT